MIRIVRFGAADLNAIEIGCSLLDVAQDFETERTGITYNTHGLTVESLSKAIELNDGELYLAFDGEIAIGTLTLLNDSKEMWYKRSTDVHPRIIKYVAVDPAFQGLGVASSLVRAATESAEGLVSVSTDERNNHAIHLYKKNGFLRMQYLRGRNASSNAVRLAFWREGCPWPCWVVWLSLALSKAGCGMKQIIRY